jgi:hypothetical protein
MDTEPLIIRTEKDIKKYSENKIISGDVIVCDEKITRLSGLNKIIGSFRLDSSSLAKIKDLKEITGDVWVSSYPEPPKIETLGSIEKIGGELRLRYSNIKDLGKLRIVEGNLSLRDTPIENLGELEYVGGNLFLPKRVKETIDISSIKIQGDVRYWNDAKNKLTNELKKHPDLIQYKETVPTWKHQYIYSNAEIKSATSDQKEFYKIYKEEFENGHFIDLKSNDNYSFILLFDLFEEYSSHKNIELLKKQYDNLGLFYPITESYAASMLINEYYKIQDYWKAWDLIIKSNQPVGVVEISNYSKLMNMRMLDGKLVSKLGGISHLTNFGQNNVAEIMQYVTKQIDIYEKEKGKEFFDLFFGVPNANEDYFKQFYFSESEFDNYKSIDRQQADNNYKRDITHVVEKAVLSQFRYILKKAEDLYREAIGMPKIGEGWISETELFYKIKNAFQDFKVVNHASPKWLGRQHLDIYFPKLNIGIEYQGAQHYEPVDFFGGQEAYEKNLERDKRKRDKCDKNGCKLIYVDEGYDFELVKREIEQIITGHNN